MWQLESKPRLIELEHPFDFSIGLYVKDEFITDPNVNLKFKFIFYMSYSLWSFNQWKLRNKTNPITPKSVGLDHVRTLLVSVGQENVDWIVVSERDRSFSIAFEDQAKASVLKLILS